MRNWHRLYQTLYRFCENLYSTTQLEWNFIISESKWYLYAETTLFYQLTNERVGLIEHFLELLDLRRESVDFTLVLNELPIAVGGVAHFWVLLVNLKMVSLVSKMVFFMEKMILLSVKIEISSKIIILEF